MLAILSVILQTRHRFCIIFSRARNQFTLNMAEIDLLSSSDENDEDFVPEGEPSSDEGSSSDHSADISDEEKGHKSRKRRKLSKKKVTKVDDKNVKEEEEEKKDEKVPDVDALWADFKEDVGKMEKRMLSHQPMTDEKPKPEPSNEKKPAESKVEPVKDEPVKVEPVKDEPVNAGSGNQKRTLPIGRNRGKMGLKKVLEQLSKKDKMSTLAKSKLDWFNFKKSEGIEEEIKSHNKGKDGYLEKQDFLQRTDLRQFEIEKQMRASKRNQ